MRFRLVGWVGLCFAVFMGLVLAFQAVAKDKAPKVVNVQGRVKIINNSTSTMTVENGTLRRQVMFSADTKFLYGHSHDNKPGSADQVKEGYYISCAGTNDAKAELMAKECIYREAK
jgi:hypothetical protein